MIHIQHTTWQEQLFQYQHIFMNLYHLRLALWDLLFQHASLKLWTFSPRLTVDFYFLYILLLKKVGE